MIRGIPERDYFERRRQVKFRYLGPLSLNIWDPAFSKLLADGWSVSIYLNGREVFDACAADPEAGTVRTMSGERKGEVEIRLSK